MRRRELDKSPEWEHWPPLTPNKETSNRGNTATTTTSLRLTESLVARTMCIILSEYEIFKLFDVLGKPATRCDADRGATGKDHVFYLELAKVLAKVDWRSNNGSLVSLPSDHEKDMPPHPNIFSIVSRGMT